MNGFNITLDQGDRFGASMDTIGDLNGDGIIDIAVGAHRDDDGGFDRGAIYVLFMDTNKTVKSVQKISSTSGNLTCSLANEACFGNGVDCVGDVDGDNIKDLVVENYHDNGGGINKGPVWVLTLQDNE